MLNTQYRMHPTISAFPSKNFYNTALKDGTVLPSGAAILSPPRSRHLSRRKSLQTGEIPSVLFIHHDNYEITIDRSKANLKEISIVMAILEDLLLSNPEMNGKDIGIISPYVAQTRLLDFTLKDDPAWAKYFEGRFGRSRAVEMKNVEVKTVDGFEGREKDVIIFSTVRNNHYGHIGFLADRRRMNVALTRAKRALFVVGSLSTLSKGRYGDDVWNSSGESMEREVGKMMIFGGGDEWQKYVQFVIAHQLFVELDHPLEYRSAEEVAEFERMHQTSTI
ncbi:hypothetical protein FRC20_000984 [Serendipita sp. 405]|nr:hypothetical protein FRC20_000984 [Serendipita sp. 405]